MAEQRIGFIGGGNMARAIIGGIAGKMIDGEHIHVVDPNADALAMLNRQFGIQTASVIDERLRDCTVLVLAVKPQQMKEVCASLREHVTRQLILSVAAGIRASDISRWLGEHPLVVRAMPNTPALIGLGMSGLAALPGVGDAQRAEAQAILSAVGKVLWLDDEAQLDPVTALSGSGPAYVFYLIEAMQRAAHELGLDAHQGRELTLTTLQGAVALAQASDEPVSQLRERVTSKGGTTYAALSRLEADDVAGSVVAAIRAASERARELGDEFGR